MANKKFTATEVMMLQERLEKGITVIAEQMGDMKHDIKELKTDVGVLKEDVAIIKASLPLKANKTELDEFDRRVTRLEAKPA
ncbi:hypothetical protein HYZ64_00820 [Candidatus Berkelbacteria bacterium]|nr:hypothetical protein [Candidatus Berkelbacteria bacterium]